MNVETIIIDVLLYIFEAWIFAFYAKLISVPQTGPLKRTALIMIGYSFLLIIYEFQNLIFIIISVVVINAILFYTLFSINLKAAFFHSSILAGIMASSEAITMLLVSIFTNNIFKSAENYSYIYLIDIVISKLSYFIIAFVIASFFANKERKEKNIKPYWIMLLLPLSDIVIMVVFRELLLDYTVPTKLYFLGAIAAFFILLSNIVVFYAFEISQKESAELSDLRAIQQKQEIDQKYFEIVDQSNKEMQLFAHDTKNHLMQIRNMENMDSVQKYIDSIYPSIDKFSSIGISQNKILDLIISKYIKLCEKNHLQFSVNVKTANLHYIADADLSTILNNLLDNSMEAAEQSQEKRISFSLYSRSKRYDALVLENSCDVAPIIEGSQLKTTKPEKRLHGLGLKSVLKVVEKYSGMYDWEYDEKRKIFKTVIAFPKTNS